MKAQLLLTERHDLGDEVFAEITLWRVPQPVRGSHHNYKYSMAYVVNSVCVLRYDNEAGKGDHRHIGGKEMRYSFSTLAQLLLDFWRDVDAWRP